MTAGPEQLYQLTYLSERASRHYLRAREPPSWPLIFLCMNEMPALIILYDGSAPINYFGVIPNMSIVVKWNRITEADK